MFDRLITLIADLWETIIPWAIIPFYERGILIRLGLYRRLITPGLVFKIPYLDTIQKMDIQLRTLELRPQSLTTSDDETIVVSGVLKFQIKDVKLFFVEIGDTNTLLNDVGLGAVKEILTKRTWKEIAENGAEHDILTIMRAEVSKYGIKLHKLTFADLAKVPTYRIIGNLPLNEED